MGREKYINPSQTSLITIIVCLVEIVRTHRNKLNPVLCKVLEKPVKHNYKLFGHRSLLLQSTCNLIRPK